MANWSSIAATPRRCRRRTTEAELVALAADAAPTRTGADGSPPPHGPEGRYQRPYEGTDNRAAAMRDYLDWEYGLVAQLERDGSHGFFVI